MSDTEDFPTGQKSIEEAMGFQEMLPAEPLPEEPKEREYTSDDRDLRRAARELVKERGPSEPEITPREYVQTAGEKAGELVEPTKTISLDRGAEDLKNLRESELAADLEAKGSELQKLVDEARSGDIGPDSAEQLAAAKAAAEASLQQYQDGVDRLDPEVQKLLQHPKLVAAVQQELAAAEQAKQQHIAQAEQARQAYIKQTLDAAKIAAATTIASFGELQGLSGDQIPTAIAVIQKQNPERAQTIINHLQHVQQLYNVSETVRAQQAQFEQQQINNWIQNEDQKFSQWAAKPENAPRVQAVRSDGLSLLQSEYGLTKADIQAINSNPAFRSVAAMQILTDALAFRRAQKTAMQAPASARAIPPVQRPGTSSYRSSDSGVEAARQSFMKSPDVKNAVALLRARRSAQ